MKGIGNDVIIERIDNMNRNLGGRLDRIEKRLDDRDIICHEHNDRLLKTEIQVDSHIKSSNARRKKNLAKAAMYVSGVGILVTVLVNVIIKFFA